MSVIGGSSLIHGVLMSADCRVTVSRPSGVNVRLDNLQKIIPIAPHTVIGFVGDVRTAARLFKLVVEALPSRKRSDPMSIMQWLPRFLRHNYTTPGPSVVFMVGSVIRDHPNVVHRDALIRVLDRITSGSAWQQNTIPDYIMRGLMTPEHAKALAYPQFPRGLLYTLAAPNFEPRHFPSLHCVAIGSGSGAEEEIYLYDAAITGSDPGFEFMAAHQLREVMRLYAEKHGIDTVGGLSPAYFIHAGGIHPFGFETEMPLGGARIQLSVNERGRWVQRNLSSGKEIELALPWEFSPGSSDQLFNDLTQAYREFLG